MLSSDLVNYADKAGIIDFYGNLRRKVSKSQIIILVYHRISPMTDKWSINPILHPKLFEEQMDYFNKNFEIISLNTLSEMINEDIVPEKAVVITFDDGYKDNYEVAFPILKKYNAPATVFLATGSIEEKKLFWWDLINYALFHTDMRSIDISGIGSYELISDENKIEAGLNIQERLKKMDNSKKESIIEDLVNLTDANIPEKLGKKYILSWKEIRKMNKNGIDFGSHTVNHPILTNVSIEEAKWEIVNSKHCIEENLDTEVKSFAYPNGDYNDKILSLVKNLGFDSSVSVYPMRPIRNSVNDLYKLNRINATLKDFNILKLYLCGLREDLNRFL